ncbi:MAG TPA: hypothetical protein VLG10_06790 [Methylomirabilota bacterium]|nr:hypothetical protein [Methylomirabilota bacterium]
MARPVLVVVSLVAGLGFVLPQTALGDPIAIVEDSAYRVGVFLVVDALVANQAPQRIEGLQVTVEFRDFFGKVKRVEHAWASPGLLGSGQVGALRVVTPYSDGVRSLRYRFTWWQDGAQFQAVVSRDISTIGFVIRDRNRWTQPSLGPVNLEFRRVS